MSTTRISAHIPDDLKASLDRLAELPPEAIVPKRIVLTPESAKLVRKLIERPPRPTSAMKRLFRDR